VFEAAILVKSTHLKKLMFENEKKRKCGNKSNIYLNIHLKDRLDIEFTTF